MKDVFNNIKQLVEDLRGLPHVKSGVLNINEDLQISWSEINGKLYNIYRLEWDNKDWHLDLSFTDKVELRYDFLDVEQEQILEEIELSLSFLLSHLQSKVPQIGEQRQKLKEQITRLQNELNALSGLNDLEDDNDD